MADRMPRETIEKLMFGTGRVRRFTQDSPILPDVWLAFGRDIEARVDLLLTPYKTDSPAVVAEALRKRLAADRERIRKTVTAKLRGEQDRASAQVAAHQAGVAAKLTFDELIRVVLPMTQWWKDAVEKKRWHERLATPAGRRKLAVAMADPENPPPASKRGAAKEERVSADVLWLTRVAGALHLHHGEELPDGLFAEPPEQQGEAWIAIAEAVAGMIEGVATPRQGPRIYSVSLNRPAVLTVALSRAAVKADAAGRLFDVSTSKLTWGIVDSGVDAAHPAFRDRKKKDGSKAARSRIRETYDFTEIRELLDPDALAFPPGVAKRMKRLKLSAAEIEKRRDALHDRIKTVRDVEWGDLVRFLRVDPAHYEPPENDHGTHVAGILAADWRLDDPGFTEEEAIEGICPDIRLYDFRVFDRDGTSNEFAIMAALQFVRHLNRTNEYVAVHGVNLSFSIEHDVANYACGRTPICDEAERLIGAGIVVVAAAGNKGYRHPELTGGDLGSASAESASGGWYSNISITDPGNAEAVITVGATHRYKPHTYGVSYFSSRGPTGDGRCKPDLVAPGEKITAPSLRDSVATKDGTSQAAPHVSGAAALLMARHPELVGQPARIKRILCTTATDLGRERYFQGAGMLDVLRALQSI